MAWQHILSVGNPTSKPFTPGTPFAIRVEGIGAKTSSLLLQSRRLDEGAEWSEGERLLYSEIISCFAVEDTEYRVVSSLNTINVFYNPVYVSQADRK